MQFRFKSNIDILQSTNLANIDYRANKEFNIFVIRMYMLSYVTDTNEITTEFNE